MANNLYFKLMYKKTGNDKNLHYHTKLCSPYGVALGIADFLPLLIENLLFYQCTISLSH